MREKEKKCTICDITLIGEYCHICGQRNTGRRITFREWLSDSIAGLFSLERSVLASWWLVIRRPEKIIGNYWAGFRGYYHSPGRLAFYAAFIIGLHFTFIGSELLGFNITVTGMSIPPQLVILILLIPLYALISKLTFFRQKHTFLEHLIAMVYLFSTWIVVFIVVDNLQRLVLGNFIDEGILLVFIIFLLLWNARLYSPSKKWFNILLYMLAEIVVLFFIITIIITFFYLVSPENLLIDRSTG